MVSDLSIAIITPPGAYAKQSVGFRIRSRAWTYVRTYKESTDKLKVTCRARDRARVIEDPICNVKRVSADTFHSKECKVGTKYASIRIRSAPKLLLQIRIQKILTFENHTHPETPGPVPMAGAAMAQAAPN